MSKINCLSPYWIGYTSASEVTLDIWIYIGTQTTNRPATPSFTLTSTPVNGRVDIEISKLVKDYWENDIDSFNFTGNYAVGVRWVDYQFTVNASSSSITSLTAFYGYGGFGDGINPQLNNEVLLSSNKILKLSGTDFNLPVNNNAGTFTINFFDASGGFTGSVSDSASTNHGNVISYYAIADTTKTIQVVGGETYNVESIDECKYTPYKVTFFNKFGVLEDLWFFKNSKLDFEVESESYKANLYETSIDYNIHKHQYKTLSKQAKQTITLNSGFYPEISNSTFKELLLSEYVWLEVNGVSRPVTVKDSSFSFKNRLTDRVINYTMQFEFAFDEINSVR